MESTGHRLAYLANLEQAWWECFKVEVFEGMLHTPTSWNKACKNMLVGDLVLIYYDGKSKSCN